MVKSGTKLFNRHGTDNSHDGRKQVGEVVTSFTKEIGGKLRTIAIACMEKADAILYDICSIEAEVHEDNSIVSDVDQVTGIAVSNSKVDSPAFKNAKRMQMVQCFSELEEPATVPGEGKTMPVTLDDLMAAPLSIIKQALVSREVHPSQIFSLTDYENDREIGPILKERITLTESNKKLTTDLATANTSIAEGAKTASLASAKDLLKARIPEGATDKQKAFMEKNFDPAKMETINETTVDEFIKDSQKNYQELAKMFSNGESSTDTDETDTDDFKPENQGEQSLEEAFLED